MTDLRNVLWEAHTFKRLTNVYYLHLPLLQFFKFPEYFSRSIILHSLSSKIPNIIFEFFFAARKKNSRDNVRIRNSADETHCDEIFYVLAKEQWIYLFIYLLIRRCKTKQNIYQKKGFILSGFCCSKQVLQLSFTDCQKLSNVPTAMRMPTNESKAFSN